MTDNVTRTDEDTGTVRVVPSTTLVSERRTWGGWCVNPQPTPSAPPLSEVLEQSRLFLVGPLGDSPLLVLELVVPVELPGSLFG